MKHGVGGEMNQVAAIEEGNYGDALGKNVVVDLFDFFLDGLEYGIGVGSFAE